VEKDSQVEEFREGAWGRNDLIGKVKGATQTFLPSTYLLKESVEKRDPRRRLGFDLLLPVPSD
jgi:hypothetical protein